MKRLLFVLILFPGVLLMAQVPGAADSLKAQAGRMVNGLTTGNYTTFIHYIHPRVVEAAGGAAALKQALQQMSRQFSISGLSFQSVTVDSLSEFVKSGTQVQATIRQHTTMKHGQGRIMATSTLIGISGDNGLHWKFVDTHNKTLEDVRQLLPNVSTELVIPPTQPPVNYDQ
ncbi:MAG TPA: hypothetical protein VG101_13380 [Puia sp.]|jgi:hypothetical protein|nr:hypothetical protein [Puia sp.]